MSSDETFVFGDNQNDIEMFDYGHSFAVANARGEVCEAADEICADMNEDGVLQVLKKLL